jgi:predicted O-methyltransferase YrrM
MKSGSLGSNESQVHEYEKIYIKEVGNTYPEIDKYEAGQVNKIETERLVKAAWYLANPLKKNPPCWQHGRLIYSTLSSYIAANYSMDGIECVDIGTAKGFSALMMQYAINDAAFDAKAQVHSTDVIPPYHRVRRNSVIEVGRENNYPVLAEYLEPFPESKAIDFYDLSGADLLNLLSSSGIERINFAFVDGKHNHSSVLTESASIHSMSQPGDIIIWDDVQIPEVARAVRDMKNRYHQEYIGARAERRYCIGVRK